MPPEDLFNTQRFSIRSRDDELKQEMRDCTDEILKIMQCDREYHEDDREYQAMLIKDLDYWTKILGGLNLIVTMSLWFVVGCHILGWA